MISWTPLRMTATDLIQASPYAVVILLVALALLFLIRHFRAGSSGKACCGSAGKDSRQKPACIKPCSQCSFSSCPTAPHDNLNKKKNATCPEK